MDTSPQQCEKCGHVLRPHDVECPECVRRLAEVLAVDSRPSW